MIDKTPVKIIAVIVIPIVLAVLIRFATWDEKDTKSKKGSDKTEKIDLKGFDNESAAKVMISWLLPEKLLEVSGIAWMDADRFACVQDELGKIFIFNARLNKIEKEIPFGPNGDYEGVAVVGKNLYVLRADGTLFGVENFASDKPNVKMYKTHLGKKQDCESLAYDDKNNRLLVAVKEEDSFSKDYKGIYGFDLTSKAMSSTPVYKINLKDAIFEQVDEEKTKNLISPSDIDINPLNGSIYILEGTVPKLLIMSPEGKLLSLYKLDKKEFPQPEGITFADNGTMFISNEGNKKDEKEGNILQVDLLNK